MTATLAAGKTLMQVAQAVRGVRSDDQRPCGDVIAFSDFANRSGIEQIQASSGRTPAQKDTPNFESKAFSGKLVVCHNLLLFGKPG